MNHPRTIRSLRRLALFLVLVAAGLVNGAGACDTPVYRYAMYRWQPAPYELYCFYEQQLPAEDQQVVQACEQCGNHETAPANLAVFTVDVQNEKALAGLPSDIQAAWKEQSARQTPWYLISTPVGVHIFGGRLTATDVTALADSPLRREIGQLMEAGKAGVYVLVTNDDPAANERAEQELRSVIDDVASGKIALATGPSTSAEEDAPAAVAVEFGYVKVARSDAQEKWLLDCLLALSPDLRSSVEPMAFLVYGRGRALFSSLGKGICRDNLTMDVEYITGACSCTVKDQNPGVDLLMTYPWHAVAEALAQKFGSEEGSPYRFGGDALFPELIIPPQESPAPSADVAAAPETATAPASAASPAPAADATTTTISTASDAPPATVSAQVAPATADVAPAATTSQASADAQSARLSQRADPPAVNPWGSVLWVGGGLIGALVVLFAATFLVLRPR